MNKEQVEMIEREWLQWKVNNTGNVEDIPVYRIASLREAYIAGRTKSMERIKELEEGLRLFLKVINRSNTALEYYGDAINNAEQLLNQTP